MTNSIQLLISKPFKTLLARTSHRRQLIASILVRRIARPLLLLGVNLMLAQPCTATPFQWEFTGSLNIARYLHTATLLLNGMVLVEEGYQTGDVYSASAELYDPASGSWSSTGSLNTARIGHTATLLPNGLVLVAGGSNLGVTLASVELYDPTSGTWSATGNLNVARQDHMATLLANGMVL